MSEQQDQLRQMYPSQPWLTASQLGACYVFAQEHLMAICRTLTMPISVRLVNGVVVVRLADVERYLGIHVECLSDLQESSLKSAAHCRHRPNLLKHEILERWFLAELRASIFNDQAIKLVGMLALQRSEELSKPQWVDCKELFAFEMALHNAEVANAQASLGALRSELEGDAVLGSCSAEP